MPVIRRQALLSGANQYYGGNNSRPLSAGARYAQQYPDPPVFAANKENTEEMLRLIGAAQIASQGSKQGLQNAVTALIQKRDRVRAGAPQGKDVHHTANKSIKAENIEQIKAMMRKGGNNQELIAAAKAIIAGNTGMDYMDVAETMFKKRSKKGGGKGDKVKAATEALAVALAGEGGDKKKGKKDKKDKKKKNKKGRASFVERLLTPIQNPEKAKKCTVLGNIVSLLMAKPYASGSKKEGPFNPSHFNPAICRTALKVDGGQSSSRAQRSIDFMEKINAKVHRIMQSKNNMKVKGILYEALGTELKKEIDSHIKNRVEAAFSREYYDKEKYPDFVKPHVDACTIDVANFSVFEQKCFEYEALKVRAKRFFHVNVNCVSVAKLLDNTDFFNTMASRTGELVSTIKAEYTSMSKPVPTNADMEKCMNHVFHDVVFKVISDAFNVTYGLLRTMCSALGVPFKADMLQKFHRIAMHIWTCGVAEKYDPKFETVFLGMLEGILAAISVPENWTGLGGRIGAFLDSACEYTNDGSTYRSVILSREYRSKGTGKFQALIWNKILDLLTLQQVKAVTMDPFSGLPEMKTFTNANPIDANLSALVKRTHPQCERYFRECIFGIAFGDGGGLDVMKYKKYALHYADQQSLLQTVVKEASGVTIGIMRQCNASGIFIFPVQPAGADGIDEFMSNCIYNLQGSVGVSKGGKITHQSVVAGIGSLSAKFDEAMGMSQAHHDAVKAAKAKITLPATPSKKGGAGGGQAPIHFITNGAASAVPPQKQPSHAKITIAPQSQGDADEYDEISTLPPVRGAGPPTKIIGDSTMFPLAPAGDPDYDSSEISSSSAPRTAAQLPQRASATLSAAAATSFFSDDDDLI